MKFVTEKELKKLKRSELLEMLIEQMKINKRLENEIKRLEDEFRYYDHTCKNSGSLAEAMLKLSGIFEAADKAAADYLSAVKSANKSRSDVGLSIYEKKYDE